jgi:hypothetical protein
MSDLKTLLRTRLAGQEQPAALSSGENMACSYVTNAPKRAGACGTCRMRLIARLPSSREVRRQHRAELEIMSVSPRI